jgi:predicted outer membrane repeat protein
VELSEGRTNSKDFIVYLDEAEIEFHGSRVPFSGYQNIRVTYTWGANSVPYQVKRLATLMVAKRVTDSVMNNSATNEGGSLSVGTISISDPSRFGENHRKQVGVEISELFRTIGQFKLYRLNKRCY